MTLPSRKCLRSGFQKTLLPLCLFPQISGMARSAAPGWDMVASG